MSSPAPNSDRPDGERKGQPAAIDQTADHDDPDQRAEEEGRKHPAVELETTELARRRSA